MHALALRSARIVIGNVADLSSATRTQWLDNLRALGRAAA